MESSSKDLSWGEFVYGSQQHKHLDAVCGFEMVDGEGRDFLLREWMGCHGMTGKREVEETMELLSEQMSELWGDDGRSQRVDCRRSVVQEGEMWRK